MENMIIVLLEVKWQARLRIWLRVGKSSEVSSTWTQRIGMLFLVACTTNHEETQVALPKTAHPFHEVFEKGCKSSAAAAKREDNWDIDPEHFCYQAALPFSTTAVRSI